MYKIYTDGSCIQGDAKHENHLAGGWGAIVIDPQGSETEYSGHQSGTTNIRSLKDGIPWGAEVEIHHDYTGISKWLTREWKRKDPDVIKLCAGIEKIIHDRGLKVSFVHVKGHSGDTMNERVDKLASAACKDGISKRS